MNLFQMASRGVSLDALPDEPLPEREPLDLGAPAVGQRFTVPDALNGAFDAAAQEYGVDADVLRAMAYAESNFNPKAVSPAGAVGLMQFMKPTADEYGIDRNDPIQSIFGAAAYMRKSLEKFDGDYGKAVASYNAGPNLNAYRSNDWKSQMPDETRAYLAKVFATADDLKARAPKPAPAAEAQPAPSAAPVAAQAPARKEVPGMTLGSVLQDVASGALQIGPTAIKGAADLARLATGDYLGKDLSDSMEGGMAAIRSTVGSDRAAAQRENFNRDMADPNVSIGQALANNKGALADQVLPTLGSMLLPVGAAGLAGKAATVGKTAAALDTAALASRVATAQQAAGIGATAAQNAADVFAGLVDKGVPMEDAYTAAGISVPFSIIAGKLTGGGAEVALARQAAGQAVKGGALGFAKGAAREGAQEVGEELGQVTGEAVGTGVTPDATTAGKRLAVAGTLGAVVGGGVDVAGNFGATPRVEDQPVVPIVPPVAQRQEPTLDVTYENADGKTVTEVIRGNQPAPQPEGTAWSEVAAADKRAQAEAEVARKLAEVDGAPPVVPAAAAQADAQAAPVSELTAPVGDIARQVLSGEASPAAPAAAPATPATEQAAPTVEQAEQQLAARESAQAAAVDMQIRTTGTLFAKGDPVALRARLTPAGVDNTIAVPGGLIVARSQAAKAQEVLSAPAPTSTTAAVTPQQEAANVQQGQTPPAQPAAQAASTTAPAVAAVDAGIPAAGVPAAGGAATAQADGVKPKPEAPIVKFRREAAGIESSLPPVAEGMTRMWRGNRPGEIGQNPVFTNDLPGIALPFRDAYQGELSYVDVPTAEVAGYTNRNGVAKDAEFTLPRQYAAQATQVERGTAGTQIATQAQGATAPQAAAEAAPDAFAEKQRAIGQLMEQRTQLRQQIAAAPEAQRAGLETQMAALEARVQQALAEGREIARSAAPEPAQVAERAPVAPAPAPARAPTATPAPSRAAPTTAGFKRWFAGSKVVDDQGAPLVMYHGTSGNERGDAFTSFDTYASNYGLMGQGSYFTADPAVASSYTSKGKGPTPSVYPVYLSIKNPIDMDAKADPAQWQAQFPDAESFHEGGDTNESWYRATEESLRDQSLPMWEGAEAMQEGLRAMGYDGITHVGGGRVDSAGVRHRVYIAFDPEQIKSATGNNGQFDPANPDIRYSKGISPEVGAELESIKPPRRIKEVFATKESVNAALAQLVPTSGRLPNGLGRIVVANADEIKPNWEPLIGPVEVASESAGRAQGFYDQRTRTVFLIADHIRAGDELAVAAHELMHKHGEAVLGAEGWNKLHSTIERWANAREGSTERLVYDEAAARVRESRPDGADEGGYSSQELFPYAVQVATEMGIKPSISAPLGSVSRWLYQVRLALQQAWTRVTGKPENFKTQDLVNLAFGIAQRENPAQRGELDNATQPDPAPEPAQEAAPPMYSRAKPDEAAAQPPAEPAAAPAAPERQLTPVPEETVARRAQRVMQDKFNRITVLSNWARDNDIQLSSEADVWGYEARMHGTVATRVEDFREDTVKPLIERIQKAGYSMEQIAEYLHAKHAQERNAQIESIDPAIKDGSGMTNAQAQAILAKAPEKMAALAAEVQAITGSTRQILLDAGIISQEMADAWDAAYKDYVPLKGGDEVKQGGTGKGLSVDGRQKRALGHGARDEKIVENILRDHERAIMLAEKNKIGQSLLVLVDELNNPDIATIGQPEKRRVLKQGSMFEARTSDGIVVDSFATQQQALNFVAAHPDMKLSVKKVTADPMVVSMASPMLGPNEVQVYLKGHAVRVQLNDELLSRAYQNLGPENLTTLMKINREVNAALSKAYTAYNPEFLLKNIARDFTAGLTITTAKYGAGVAARAVKNYPKAMAQLLRFGFTKKASPSMMSYRLAGGSTGAAYLSDLQRIGEDVRATFDDARGVAATARADGTWRGTRSLTRKSLRFGLKYLEILNAAGESAMRLAVFEAMRETNHDVRESANAAKELLNFNRSGEATRSVGGWFLFLNASIQGTAAVADAMINGKNRAQGWAMVAAMAALQYTLRSLQYADDDEDKKAWGRISDDTKTKNLIFRTGADSFAKVPLPYGLAAFYGLGNAAYDIEHGEDVDKVALRVALTFADQFLPIKPYSETGDMRALVEAVPGAVGGELMRAGMRAAVNRSGLGGDIVPDSKFDEGKPDNLKAYRSTRTSVYQTIATQLNAASGGTPTQAGLVDVSPETLKYWVRTLTGGAGAFVADVAGLVRLGKEYYDSEGDPDRNSLMPELSEVPIVRGFMGEDRITDDRRNYWAAAKDVSRAQQDFQRARKGDDEQGLQRVDDQRGELLYLVDAMTRNSGHIREIRDEIEAVMLDDSTSMAFKRAAVKKLEAEESGIYREFIDVVAEDRAEAKKERASAKK